MNGFPWGVHVAEVPWVQLQEVRGPLHVLGLPGSAVLLLQRVFCLLCVLSLKPYDQSHHFLSQAFLRFFHN